ncbi:nb-arc and tpr domain protein [Lasallia pustulata]|uniref:Nb-arc and tpr domain protein n=1 Tax=Lasallia pustulata TaxID=136370 RepID=A0A1W5D317_9LECA|nr:nb-arc and tpr domain protein [Lasallia pustulata]
MSMLDTGNNVGGVDKDHGKMAEAEAMYRRALEGYEKAWGPEHMSMLDTVNNLGVLYKDQGKMAEAEAMYRRALEGQGEGVGAGAHVDAGHGPQPGEALRESRQDGRSGSHVSTGVGRV